MPGSIWMQVLNSFTPKQLCWTCLGLVLTFGAFGSTYAYRAFASTESVKGLETRVTRMEVRDLEESIFNLRVKQCAAIKEGQSGAAYRERLTELLRQYHEITKTTFALPDCSEL